MIRHIAFHMFLTIWGVFFICVILLIGIAYGWSSHYIGRIPPNVWIGTIPVGGLDPEEAKEIVQTKIDSIIEQGVSVTLMEKDATLPLTTSTSSNVTDDVWFDADSAIQTAMSPERAQRPFFNTFYVVRSLFKPIDVTVPVEINRAQIMESADRLFPTAKLSIIETSFVFHKDIDGWKGEIRDGTPGYEYQWSVFFDDLSSRLSQLTTHPVTLSLIHRDPAVSAEAAASAMPKALALLERAPFTLSFPSVESPGQTSVLSDEDLAQIIAPQKDEGGSVSINQKSFEKFVKSLGPIFERRAVEGRFRMENGRVAEFVQSVNGRLIDRDALAESILSLLKNETETTVIVPMLVAEPKRTLEQANTLGIKEILGEGISSFKGSPANRIKNIKNGVRLLDGILIAPGETFSLLNALKPFTEENGYFPELVIKGDRIKPELGGGLCQIGTTTFRSALNSGLQIVERSNHSLVVSYYNDLSNNNPGTDATIYEPAPDFKFLNDTGNTILFQAKILPETSGLRFTFWGTSDGRNGSYNPPIVSKWIPVGDPKIIETLDLPTGEKKCQESHVGADASFVYKIKRANETTTERVFSSHYRPLPEICLIGVEKISEPTQTSTEPPSADTSIPLIP